MTSPASIRPPLVKLAPRLGLREVPEIRFLLDTSIQKGARVDELLRRIASGEIIDDEPR